MNPQQLDLEDWELLTDDGFLDINRHGIYPKTSSTTVYQKNYFICPAKSVENTRLTASDTVREKEEKEDLAAKQEEIMIPRDDLVNSQVSFKKTMETEYLDIKVESPKSRGILTPRIESGAYQYEEKDVSVDGNSDTDDTASGNNVFNILKWSSTGIGAICSFGVAAATVCIVILSSSQRKNQNHKIHFQIYTDGQGQRMNRVVHGSKIHEAISAAGGGAAAFTGARITCGGHYDASTT